jgi:hypothetical protein
VASHRQFALELIGFPPFVPAWGQFPAKSTMPKDKRKSRKIRKWWRGSL